MPVDKILLTDWADLPGAEEACQGNIPQVFPDDRDIAIGMVIQAGAATIAGE